MPPTKAPTDKGSKLMPEEREKLLALAGDCWDREWDVNQDKVDEFIGYVEAALLTRIQAEARERALEEAAQVVNIRKNYLDRVYDIERWNELQWTEDAIRALAQAHTPGGKEQS